MHLCDMTSLLKDILHLLSMAHSAHARVGDDENYSTMGIMLNTDSSECLNVLIRKCNLLAKSNAVS